MAQPKRPKSGGGRKPRLASLLEHTLAEYFRSQLDLPGLVSISHVEVAPNFQAATIWLSIFAADENEVLRILLRSRGSMRKELTRVLSTKYIPQLTFKFDPSEAHAQRISELINEFDEE